MRIHDKTGPDIPNILYPQSGFDSLSLFLNQNDTILCVHLMAWDFALIPMDEHLLSMLWIEDIDMNCLANSRSKTEHSPSLADTS